MFTLVPLQLYTRPIAKFAFESYTLEPSGQVDSRRRNLSADERSDPAYTVPMPDLRESRHPPEGNHDH